MKNKALTYVMGILIICTIFWVNDRVALADEAEEYTVESENTVVDSSTVEGTAGDESNSDTIKLSDALAENENTNSDNSSAENSQTVEDELTNSDDASVEGSQEVDANTNTEQADDSQINTDNEALNSLEENEGSNTETNENTSDSSDDTEEDPVEPVYAVVRNANDMSGAYDVVITLDEDIVAKKVIVRSWSLDDHSDIYRYVATRQTDGSYLAHIDVANHDCNYGTYHSRVYVVDGNGTTNCLTEVTQELVKTSATAKYTAKSEGKTYVATLGYIPGTLGESLKSVSVIVWNEESGKSSRCEFTAKLSGNKYKASIDMKTLGSKTGTYIVKAYAVYSNGQKELIKKDSFEATNSAATSVVNLSNVKGSFDVKVTDVNVVGGPASIKVAIWSGETKDNLKWYTAEKSSDGAYYVHMDVADHNCDYGTYKIRTYVIDQNGNKEKVGTITQEIVKSTPSVTVDVGDGTEYSISAKNIAGTKGKSISKVRFAVWSENGGKDDLVWYTATLKGSKYVVDAPSADHNYDLGKYYVLVYTTYTNGVKEKSTITSFDMENSYDISIQKIGDIDRKIRLTVSNVCIAGGVSAVKVPVWSQEDKSDLVWYTAKKQSDGSYKVIVDIANHDCNYGTYKVLTYFVTNVDGKKKMKSDTVNMVKPTDDIGQYTDATVTVKNKKTVSGYCDIVISKPFAVEGVDKVRVAVWSNEDKSNLKWYTAKKQSDNTYKIHVDVASHDCVFGTYYFDTYVYDKTGSKYLADEGETALNASTAKIASIYTANQTISITLKNVPGTQGKSLKTVKVAAWTQDNGKDDLKWYTATLSGSKYVVSFDASAHTAISKTFNLYVQATYTNGDKNWVLKDTYDYTVSSKFQGYGIDVSQYQGDINWASVKASGVNYAIIRCIGNKNGGSYLDSNFITNIQNAYAAGVNVGIYVYSGATTVYEACQEAYAAINIAQQCSINIPIFMDVESTAQSQLSKSDLTTIASAFCQTVAGAGYRPGVYSSLSWWIDKLDYATLCNYYIWIARYNSTLSDDKYTWNNRCDIWQFTSSGSVNGINGNVDMDYAF